MVSGLWRVSQLVQIVTLVFIVLAKAPYQYHVLQEHIQTLSKRHALLAQ